MLPSAYRLYFPHKLVVRQRDRGGTGLKGLPEDRAVRFAQYIIDTGATVRDTAKKFDISKSTVHKDITERLEQINHTLYLQVRAVLTKNKEERHIRGGMATKMKYARQGSQTSPK